MSRSVGIAQIIPRSETSWLIDGMLHISEFKDFIEVEELPNEEKYRFDTLAGFMVALFGNIPNTGEKIIWKNYEFEIVDMDNKRIDMIIMTRLDATSV